jgi:ubiquinone/menaquinone biosynthesis C-methylase UbiE
MAGRFRPLSTSTDPKKSESEAWLSNYANADEIARRRKEMPEKLQALGLTPAQKHLRVLDLCCGHGEALDCLHGMGFRALEGVDLTIPEPLVRDSRFKVKSASATDTQLPSGSYDWITCIHSMHHFASAKHVEAFLDESWRLLKPGGRLSIIDFPASPQIKLAFRFFRMPYLHFTPYLRYFGKIIQEEWIFLQHYLPQWPSVQKLIWHGRFEVQHSRSTLFYFYVTLKKPSKP